ncbi:MAG: hypothetical protein H6516_13380 [Microthrixaceae bacterium]|nr:hypothetical protein [Microthrixaceae bacterium]
MPTVMVGEREEGHPDPSVADGDVHRWRFQPPRLRDPRLHVAAVVVSVQVLGQVALGFDLSIAQILVCLLTAAAIELALTAPRTRVVAWPASALLTGNGIALILRVPGTEHGDWWSMRGWYVFAATTAVGVLSKYVLRSRGRPLFNPSNLALVVTFLVLGSGIADPQDLWWGPMSVGLAATYAIVVVGGVLVTRRLDLLRVSVAFWSVFAALMGVLAISGHAMTARWNLGPVAGMQFWTTLALSPEVLIFVFFMITDPRTGVTGRAGGVLYGAAVALTSGVLIAFQSTEYATKVALLAGLVVVCALRPVLEHLAPADPPVGVLRWTRQRRPRHVGGCDRDRRRRPDGAGFIDHRIGSRAADRGPSRRRARRGPAAAGGDRRRARWARRLLRDRAGPTGRRRPGSGHCCWPTVPWPMATTTWPTRWRPALPTGPLRPSPPPRRRRGRSPERSSTWCATPTTSRPSLAWRSPSPAPSMDPEWSATYHVLATTADVRIERELRPG